MQKFFDPNGYSLICIIVVTANNYFIALIKTLEKNLVLGLTYTDVIIGAVLTLR